MRFSLLAFVYAVISLLLCDEGLAAPTPKNFLTRRAGMTCPDCGQTFTRKDQGALDLHYLKKHPDHPALQGDRLLKAQKASARKSASDKKTAPLRPKVTMTCSICGKTYAKIDQSALDVHYLTDHTGTALLQGERLEKAEIAHAKKVESNAKRRETQLAKNHDETNGAQIASSSRKRPSQGGASSLASSTSSSNRRNDEHPLQSASAPQHVANDHAYGVTESDKPFPRKKKKGAAVAISYPIPTSQGAASHVASSTLSSNRDALWNDEHHMHGPLSTQLIPAAQHVANDQPAGVTESDKPFPSKQKKGAAVAMTCPIPNCGETFSRNEQAILHSHYLVKHPGMLTGEELDKARAIRDRKRENKQKHMKSVMERQTRRRRAARASPRDNVKCRHPGCGKEMYRESRISHERTQHHKNYAGEIPSTPAPSDGGPPLVASSSKDTTNSRARTPAAASSSRQHSTPPFDFGDSFQDFPHYDINHFPGVEYYPSHDDPLTGHYDYDIFAPGGPSFDSLPQFDVYDSHQNHQNHAQAPVPGPMLGQEQPPPCGWQHLDPPYTYYHHPSLCPPNLHCRSLLPDGTVPQRYYDWDHIVTSVCVP